MTVSFKSLSLLLLVLGTIAYPSLADPSADSGLDDTTPHDELHPHLRNLGKSKSKDKSKSNKDDRFGNGGNGVVAVGTVGGGGLDRAGGPPSGVPVLGAGGCNGVDRVLAQNGPNRLTESKCGILERAQCTNPYAVSEQKKMHPSTDSSCLDGSCGGCCRDFTYLVCDDDGQTINSWVPCVCSERTFGGNPFTPGAVGGGNTAIDITSPGNSGSTPAVPVPVPATPAIPVPATPVNPAQGGTGDRASDAAVPGCNPAWRGKGLGEVPPSIPPNFPTFLAPGECSDSTHCAGTPGACCLKDFCLCGTPSGGRANCR